MRGHKNAERTTSENCNKLAWEVQERAVEVQVELDTQMMIVLVLQLRSISFHDYAHCETVSPIISCAALQHHPVPRNTLDETLLLEVIPD